MEYQIRNYEPRDQTHVLDFFRVVFTAMGFGFDLHSKHQDLCEIPIHYQSNGIFLLATQNEQLLGTAALRTIAPGICELKRFYVLPDQQHRGIGTQLFTQILAAARAGPWTAIRLDTTRKSPAAISIFQKNGFGEIPRYNDNANAEIFMELILPPTRAF